MGAIRQRKLKGVSEKLGEFLCDFYVIVYGQFIRWQKVFSCSLMEKFITGTAACVDSGTEHFYLIVNKNKIYCPR